MRSTEAGISSADCDTRVAVTTIASCSCAVAHADAAASAKPPSFFLISFRLPGMLTSVTLAAFLALYAISAWAQADPALLAKLRQGGYVLFLRHTSTDFSQNDQKMTGYEDCATQRNLTDKGRDEARALGAAIK